MRGYFKKLFLSEMKFSSQITVNCFLDDQCRTRTAGKYFLTACNKITMETP